MSAYMFFKPGMCLKVVGILFSVDTKKSQLQLQTLTIGSLSVKITICILDSSKLQVETAKKTEKRPIIR